MTLLAQNGYCMPVTQLLTVRPPNLVGIYVLIGNMFPNSTMVDTDGQKKCEHLSFVGKAALTLSRGNAAPERDFPSTMLC